MSIETCINCSRTIGKLEQAYVYKENVVCSECNDRLLKAPNDKSLQNDLSAPAETEEVVVFEQHPAPFKGNPALTIISVILILVGIGLIMPFWLLFDAKFTHSFIILTFAGVGLVLLFWLWLEAKFTKLTVTNKRIKIKSGILSRKTTEVRHSDVRNIQVVQGILERLLGVGAIQVGSAAHAGMEISLGAMVSPDRIADLIRQYQS